MGAILTSLLGAAAAPVFARLLGGGGGGVQPQAMVSQPAKPPQNPRLLEMQQLLMAQLQQAYPQLFQQMPPPRM